MITKPLAIAMCLAVAPAVPALAQCPVQRLTQPADLTANFGAHATEIEGDHLIVADGGAYTACSTPDPIRCSAGAVFAYRRDGDQWAPIQTIVPDDIRIYDGFGLSLDIDGDRMLVITGGKAFDGNLGYFHEYVFDRSTEQWVEFSRTSPPGTDPDATPIGPITFDGSLALLGQGPLIHRYTQDAEGWVYRDSFESPDGLGGDSFGQTIMLEGEWAFITAWNDDSASPPTQHGSVYAFRRHADDTLEFVQKLLPPGVGDGQARKFGINMDFNGETLAVSDPNATIDHRGQGAVYLYEYDGDQWTLGQTLTHSDAGITTRDRFGLGVSIDGDTLMAGTPFHNHCWCYEFRNYVFRRGADGTWREVGALTPGDAVPFPWLEEDFGWTGDIEGDRVVVAAPGEYYAMPPFTQTGAVYAFDLGCEICKPDLDGDGALTVFDFLTFLNLFDAGSSEADFDGDGELTIFDFLAFQGAFDAGCD